MNCLTEETAFELSLETIWKLKEMTWTETQAADPLCSGNLQVVCPGLYKSPYSSEIQGILAKSTKWLSHSVCLGDRKTGGE